MNRCVLLFRFYHVKHSLQCNRDLGCYKISRIFYGLPERNALDLERFVVMLEFLLYRICKWGYIYTMSDLYQNLIDNCKLLSSYVSRYVGTLVKRLSFRNFDM